MARRRKNTKKKDETLVDIVEVRDQAQDFFERNQNLIIGVTFGILLLVAGWLAYKYLYMAPREQEASEQMSQAIFQFNQDSFALALTNPGGEYSGFESITEEYGGTSAGNLANYYAGISSLRLSQFDNAIEYLEDFNPGGNVTPIMRYGALGDAYSEKNDLKKALNLYDKATTAGENSFLQSYYLKKLGLLHRRQGNNDKALKAFSEIKNNHRESIEANDIELLIDLVK